MKLFLQKMHTDLRNFFAPLFQKVELVSANSTPRHLTSTVLVSTIC